MGNLPACVVFREPDEWKWVGGEGGGGGEGLDLLEAMFYFVVSRSNAPNYNDCLFLFIYLFCYCW